jgi:hypothetical protein
VVAFDKPENEMAKKGDSEGMNFLVHFKRPTSKKFVARMIVTTRGKTAAKNGRLERNLGLHRAVDMAIELLKACKRSGQIPNRRQRRRSKGLPDSPPSP